MKKKPRKILKNIAMVIGGLFIVLIASNLLVNLYENIRVKTFPRAFLDSRFGMSEWQVEESLGQDLISYDDYELLVDDPIIDHLHAQIELAIPPIVLRELENRMETKFSKPINVFEARADAKYIFIDGKLNNVEAHFRKTFNYLGGQASSTEDLVERIKKSLDESYNLVSRYEFEGGYGIEYKKEDMKVKLIVDSNSESIIIDLNYLPYIDHLERVIKKRSESVF